jgi:WD40 repeat protein
MLSTRVHDGFLSANEVQVSLESGEVNALRVGEAKPLYTVSAHSDPCTSVEFNAKISDCWLTASVDGTIKVWDAKDGNVSCVATKETAVVSLLLC